MNDKAMILAGEWVPCRICEAAFGRLRQTARYCFTCENAYCEGEHGNFAYTQGRCVVCGSHKSYRTRQFKAEEIA